MKREELSHLARDLLMAGMNGSHLGSDRVHLLTQSNMMLLRLIPIYVKPCSECMNLICMGLSQTKGDLKVTVLGDARTRCGC